MLAQIGVKSYYIIVNATRGVVTKDSPASPGGFNHMILAIALPEASYAKPLPAMYQHPKLGHLLIFDPTNDFVPFGRFLLTSRTTMTFGWRAGWRSNPYASKPSESMALIAPPN